MHLDRRLGWALMLIAAPVLAEPEAETEALSPKATLPIARPAQAERSQQMEHALRARLSADSLQTLSTPSESFLALWQDAHTATPQGLVILLPGRDQHADQPGVIQPLRLQLPRHGWQTLSLTLPDPFNHLPLRQPVPTVVSGDPQAPEEQSIASPAQSDEHASAPIEQVQAQETEEAQEQAPHAPTQPATDPEAEYAERMFDRIDAALAFAKTQKPKELILLGHGSGAYWSARYMQARTPKDVSRLVWLQAESLTDMRQSLNSLLAEIKVPVADFVSDPAHNADRKALAARLPLNGYRALSLPLYTRPAEQQEQVVRRVRGYLSPAR